MPGWRTTQTPLVSPVKSVRVSVSGADNRNKNKHACGSDHQRMREIKKGGIMAKKLYVGNLSYNTHDEDLREAFSKIGEVLSVTLIVDQATGRSKGFGFVEMASDEDAQKAISTMNGANFMDRTIVVNEARPKTEGGRGRSGFGGGGGGGRDKRGGYGGGGRSWR
jgi:RNA recognition motif-containing protein